MKKFVIYFLLVLFLPTKLLAQTYTVGTTGADFPTLFDAFDFINNANTNGDLVIQIIDNTNETVPAVLNSSNGGANYSSLVIYPTVSGLSISGSIAGPLINLNSADHITIDGRVNQAGAADLIITNTNTGSSASTIQFIESANTNIIQYCNIKGSETNASGGVIFFSTATSGTGNDGNTIDNNYITSDAAGRPINAIFSSGTSSRENSGNTLSNNNIYDFLKNGTASNGIYLSSNTTSCTISDNSFYESASFAPSAPVTYYPIQINNASGTGFTVTGNYIGGSTTLCGSTAWTKTAASNNVFSAIYMNVGTSTPSSIQNNTIKNFVWSNSLNAIWTGIQIAGGAVNVGTSTGNTIGATTGTGSILVTGGASSTIVYGINIASGGTVDCQNNNIGSITAANSTSTNASNIFGINKTGTPGTTTISNNNIGSTSTSGSIFASSICGAVSSNSQTIYGIFNAGTGTITINSNTIANLTNATTNTSSVKTGLVDGIASTAGTNTISNNIIRDLTIANANGIFTQNASLCGIALTGNSLPKTVIGNTIYNLSNTYVSFGGTLIGIYFSGSTGSNIVSNNFIHDISVTGGSSTTANIYGIKTFLGATTYSNNIISLGGSTSTTLYGIFETGPLNNNNSLYFNTIYIGGSLSSGNNKSYALNSAVTTNIRNFRNNIFYNARSNTGGSGAHYGIYIASAGGSITTDYNDYYTSGTGGMLGYLGSNKPTLLDWQTATGQDVSSFAIDPVFAVPGGTVAANYMPSAATLVAVTGTEITTDYAGTTRSLTYPSMGAYEYTVAPGSWKWTGATSTDWSTASNWNYNTFPSTSGNAIITSVGFQPIVNEAPATPAQCFNLTINSPAVLTIAAGKALKVTGTLTNYGIAGLVIKSYANGNDGKLINNTSSVPGTVELYLSGGIISGAPRFHYFVPPVSTMTIGADIASVKANLGLTYFNGVLVSYSESVAGSNKDNGWQYFDGYNNTTLFSFISSTQGYNIYLPADDKITFTGTLNAAAHSFTLNYSVLGFNLVGNPYPCNYDLSGISALSSPTPDAVDNTIYFRKDGGLPAVWNVQLQTGETGYSNIVAPMQGFFVQVTGTSSLSLPTASKTTGTADPLRGKGESSTNATSVKKIKLVLNNGLASDETIVCLVDKATTGFDGNYDAYKIFDFGSLVPSVRTNPGDTYKLPDSGDKNSSIYTDLNSIKYAINSVRGPDTKTPTVIIPVSVVINTPGTYRIDITEFENLEGIPVVLKHGDIETNLSKDVSYSFTSGAGTFTDFQLIIGENKIPKVTGEPTGEILKTWYSNNYLYINCAGELSSDKGNLTIYDFQGKIVFNNNQLYITTGETIQTPINLPKGLYITRLLVNSHVFVSKIVVF